MTYRMEYPRPNYRRKNWECLNGTWDFCFQGEAWCNIEVPFVFQSKLSGINDNRMCDVVTYQKEIIINKEWETKRILLHFGAVDYQCKVYINNQYLGEHIGGNAPFTFDITEALHGELTGVVEVCVFDPCKEETIPRGKQFWEEDPDSIWYKRTTGIWQTVWMEAVENIRFGDIRFTTNIDKGTVDIEYEVIGQGELESSFEISYQGNRIYKGSQEINTGDNRIQIDVFGNKIFRMMTHGGGWCWSPEQPNLFEVKARLFEKSNVMDEVDSYFGMRKIEIKSGMVYLNNRPYYQKLILDQGYWPDTLMTAKTDEDFIRDIEMAKELGFNGCRKHQKAEDPRFLYHADRLGFLVWGETGACASYSVKSAQRTVHEWNELVVRDYNHPCIVAWVVLNESWGVPNIGFDQKQQAHSLALYYHVRSMDDTRLIVNNDGWELTKTDICAIHNYEHGAKDEVDKQEKFQQSLATKEDLLESVPTGRTTYADGYTYQGEPMMLTEFGGLAFAEDSEKAWGYTTIASEEEFLETYDRLLSVIYNSKALYGYCYTQLTDVEQEMNGLLTYDRRYKVDVKRIKAINDKVFKIRVI